MKTLIWLAGVLTCLWCGEAWAQEWSDPVLVDSNDDTVGVNTHRAWDWCPYVSADGQHLYFTSDRRGYTNFDIYVCHRNGAGWSDPLLLPFCQLTVDERSASVNATNDTLYFISWTPGWDIYWAFRTGPCDTCWGQPERMPEPINSSGIEFSTWATPDNQRLLFHSIRSGTGGLEDIFECRRDASAPTGWSAPVPLAGPLHTWDTEEYPSMGLDTTELFFVGRRDQICVSTLTDSGWSFGTPLPSSINCMVNGYVTASTPCITPDGTRLYFYSECGDPYTNGDIWYSDRVLSAPPRSGSRQGAIPQLRVYPNPVKDGFTLYLPEGLNRVTVFDLLGRTVACQAYPNLPRMVHYGLGNTGLNLASGVFFVSAASRNINTSVMLQVIK